MPKFSILQILTRKDIEKIHEASLDVLSSTGVKIPHEGMLDLFAQSGSNIDKNKHIVKIPKELIELCLKSCGKQFIITGRNKAKQAKFGYGIRNYNTIFGEANWFDYKTGERRYTNLADVAIAAKVADALPYINIAGAMADPHDLPISYRCIEVAATLIKNTTKPIGLWFHDRLSAKFLVELFEAAAGSSKELKDAPIAYPFLEPISPLSFTFDSIDLLFETCKVPLPVPIGPMAQVGASGPVTLAGTLVQENAEILAGICITQLIHEGTPVCYGGIPHAFDMKTTQMIFSGPEQALMAVSMVQIAKYYGLPVYINVGLTDSKIPDAQAGLEAGITLLSGILSGADIFGHMGISGVDQAASLPILILQHEIIAYIERIMRGFQVITDTMALDEIKFAGPGGNYLTSEHTLAHFRNELWFPTLLDRSFFEQWENDGRTSMADRIIARLDSILENHQVEQIDRYLEKEIDEIVISAKHYL